MIRLNLKNSLLILVSVVVMLAGSSSHAEKLIPTSKKGCQVVAPEYPAYNGPKFPIYNGPRDASEIWKDRTLSWEGECKHNMAYGIGILRGFKKGEKTLLFLGRLVEGKLGRGTVIFAGDDFYDVGPFMADDVEDGVGQEQNYQFAMQAAKAFSRTLAKAGNHTSAKFYSDLAKRFKPPEGE